MMHCGMDLSMVNGYVMLCWIVSNSYNKEQIYQAEQITESYS